MSSRPSSRAEAVDRLVTRLPSDAGYAGSQDVPSGPRKGLPVYVCPRADDFGRRDGLVPPGVAAVRGLVPRTGLRRVTNSSVGRAAAGDGRTEAERYRDYYGQGAPAGRDDAETADSPEARERPEVRPSRQAARPGQSPARPVPGAGRTAKTGKTENTAAKTPEKRRKTGAVPVLLAAGEGQDAETLDGFYDSLGGAAPGTGEGGAEERESLASARGERLPPHPQPRAQGDPCESAAAESARLREALDAARAALGTQQGLIARLEAEVDALRRQPGPVDHETVRVRLDAEPERLKLGGRGWECRILGHLDFGREWKSLVLTVTDPGYASELIAAIRPGPLVVLHGRERTSCAYAGECCKLYGDSGGSDFIAVFRFSVSGD